MVEPLRIHDIAPRSGLPKAVRISGKAMLTMNKSRLARNAATDTTRITKVGEVVRVVANWVEACVVVMPASRSVSLDGRQPIVDATCLGMQNKTQRQRVPAGPHA